MMAADGDINALAAGVLANAAAIAANQIGSLHARSAPASPPPASGVTRALAASSSAHACRAASTLRLR